MGVQIKIEGDRDLLAAFKSLRTNMGPKWLMRSIRSSANVLKTFIAASAPADTGRLRRNIRLQTKKTMETVRARVVVNTSKPRKGDSKNERNAYYWRFVEKGHRVRAGSKWGPKTTRRQYLRKKDRQSGGYAGPTTDVPAQPFVGPIWMRFRDWGVDNAVQVFERVIDREISRTKRRTV